MNSGTITDRLLKRTDATYIFSFINKLINTLKENTANKIDKREAIDNLYTFIVKDEPVIPKMITQEILISFNKNLIKLALFDNLDRIREFSLKILIQYNKIFNLLLFSLYSNCTNVTKFFPFVFSALVDKLECSDLEGVSDLPEDIRPTPSQKPHKINKITENCEEIRALYIKLLESLIFDNEDEEFSENINNLNIKSNDDFRMFVSDIVNISRTLIMDPCSNVVRDACYMTRRLCMKFGKDLLFHFNSIISRALYSPLTSKQSKMRLAALDCLDKLLQCSPFKKNTEILEQLIGFRDPNLVPIKDFYEPTTKLNYLALLVADPSLAVVKKFFELITSWLINLEDRFDHEARLIPYVLSGLSNPNEEICEYVSVRLEDIGRQFEIDNEKDIRDNQQYGVDSPWVKYCSVVKEANGFVNVEISKNINYPFPVLGRPTLGARLMVRKYLRRYVTNLCKEYESIEESIKIKVSNLILYSIVYAEDGITEYLDELLLCFEREIIRVKSGRGCTRESPLIIEPMFKSLKLLGRFCDYESVTKLLYPTILGDFNGNYPDIQKGGLICLGNILIGHLESISNDREGFGIFNEKFKEVIGVINNKRFIDYLDSSTGIELIDFYEGLLKVICLKKESFKANALRDVKESLDHMFDHLVRALGAIAIFDLHGVSNNEVMKLIEIKFEAINKFIIEILDYGIRNENNLNNINENNSCSLSFSFFTLKVKQTLSQINTYLENNHLTLNTKEYKIFFVFLKQIKLFMNLEDFSNNQSNIEIIKLTFKIFSNIFNSSYNYPIHQDTIKLLSGYLNNSLIDISNNSVLIISFLDELVTLFVSVLKPYDNLQIDKFKFADLLKDEKELEKTKVKAPKTIKSEIREKVLIIIKNILNKNSIFSIANSNKKCLEMLLDIFDESIFKEFTKEKESNRKFYVELYYLFLVKYFTSFKIKINLNINSIDNGIEFNVVKKIINDFESYFNEEIFDSVMEVRQMNLNILNLIICAFDTSKYFEPMCKLFNSFNEEKDYQKFNFESLKILAYVEEENKNIDGIFKNFKNIFSIILNLYIDEKSSFGNLCEGIIKNILDKFPIFSYNELIKAKNKNQMTRIDVLNKLLIKYLKNK